MKQNFPSIKGIHSITVIHPDTGNVLLNQDILIENNRIKAILPALDSRPDEQWLSGKNLFVIPGLIDTHVHSMGIMLQENPELIDFLWIPRQLRKNLAAYVKSGVTTIRDMAAPAKLIRKFSRRASSMEILSPRILYAGPILTVRGGYPYFLHKTTALFEHIAGSIRVDVDDEKNAINYADKLADWGVDCIKIAFQSVKYDKNKSSIPLISRKLFEEIVTRAHHHNLPAAVHHCYRKDFKKLLDLPFDCLEHLTIDDILSEDEVSLFSKMKIPVSTTMATYGLIDHLERLENMIEDNNCDFEKKPRAALKETCKKLRADIEVSPFISLDIIKTGSKFMRANLKSLKNAGVAVICGTDSGGAATPPGSIHWELIDMVRAGMSDIEALRSATCIAASVLGIPELGSLKNKAFADLVILRKNPLDDIGSIKEVAAVIRNGHLLFKSSSKS